jgi:aryl-alcohol dehydrogenase-like predicted oxidoreductase
MLYREFGSTGWNVSVIGMGTWNIGNQWGEIEESTALATVNQAFSSGVNLFDTAEAYGIPQGLSEERLGKALHPVRNQCYLISKIGSWGRRTGEPLPRTVDNIRLCLQASLFRLKTDWLDAVLCHEGDLEDPSVYLDAFEHLKAQGYIRTYGISTNDFEVLKRFNTNHTCQIVALDYSLLNRKPEAQIFPYCQEHGIAVISRGPLAQGLLAGKYSADTVFTDTVRSKWHKNTEKQQKFQRNIASVEALKKTLHPGEELATTALRFAISHPVQPVAIPGAKSVTQAAMNAQAGDQLLSEEHRTQLIESLNPVLLPA